MSKETIILGGGCFWCLEAVFQQFNGILKVSSGYAGSDYENPTYKAVCSGTTGHAEVVKIDYDSEIISLSTILEIFFVSHDPTTLNRQGNDVGTQYRSIVFYNNEEEHLTIAQAIKAAADNLWSNPIVTQVAKHEKFYPAEEYHQDYYKNNPTQGYCTFVVGPKVAKAKSKFSNLLAS